MKQFRKLLFSSVKWYGNYICAAFARDVFIKATTDGASVVGV